MPSLALKNKKNNKKPCRGAQTAEQRLVGQLLVQRVDEELRCGVRPISAHHLLLRAASIGGTRPSCTAAAATATAVATAAAATSDGQGPAQNAQNLGRVSFLG